MNFLIGHDYRFIYERDNKQFEAIMQYIGDDADNWVFNLRPIAGTQTFSKRWTHFVDVEDLGKTDSRPQGTHQRRAPIKVPHPVDLLARDETDESVIRESIDAHFDAATGGD